MARVETRGRVRDCKRGAEVAEEEAEVTADHFVGSTRVFTARLYTRSRSPSTHCARSVQIQKRFAL